MSKLMLITPRIATPPEGGRALLSHLHCKCLSALLGDRLVVHALDRTPVAGPRARLHALAGFIDGVTPQAEQAVIAQIGAQDIGRIFINGSNLGRIARAVKRQLPNVEVFTFFHNVEARFFQGALRDRWSARALAVLVANHRAERMAVRSSDRLIALNERDSRGLAKLYGRAATDLLPMALEDKFQPGADDARSPIDEDYLLFVGGGFYANLSGMRWFVEQVAPHIAIRTCIVGRGLESLRDEVSRRPNVALIGPVGRLDDWYRGAKAVVAPIFDGSGMKTKVAEALMFGKRIVGTNEAFCGYEALGAEAGWLCETQSQFVSALRTIEALPLPRFDPSLRSLYELHYSEQATLYRLARLLS
ncbi:MAG: glycosyltransferase [Alphaproteobacteria bacterium]|nr:glycosyltransferase [Alphaproteobacteria bacterium]